MVEGPGCTSNGRKARSHIGKRIIGVNGQQGKEIAPVVRGHTLVSVLTLGKELWLIFGPPQESTMSDTSTAMELRHAGTGDSSLDHQTAVRLHFGMNGSLHLDKSEPKYPGARASLTLGLIFESCHRLRAFQATASVERSVAAILEKHIQGAPRDVCGSPEVFDPAACAAALAALPPSTLITDAVLDQAVLPGAGNIIKNEALHRARIDPAASVGSLSPADLQRVVLQVRNYSMGWLRAGRAPAKLIYNRTECGDCGGKVRMQKLGGAGHLARPTFWCPACCERQTVLVVQGTAGQGAASGKRPNSPVPMEAAVGPFAIARRQALAAAERKRARLAAAQDVAPAAGAGSMAMSPACAEPQPAAGWGMALALPSAVSGHQHSHGTQDHTMQTSQLPPVSMPCLQPDQQHRQALPVPAAKPVGQMLPVPSAGSSQRPGHAATCPTHGGRSIALKRTRKAGPNLGRLFFSCQAKGCSYFLWADSGFPRCHCPHGTASRQGAAVLRPHNQQNGDPPTATASGPGRVPAVLRISKKEKTGGRWFFCCGGADGSGSTSRMAAAHKGGMAAAESLNQRCDFFAWAIPSQLEPLGQLLTPLS